MRPAIVVLLCLAGCSGAAAPPGPGPRAAPASAADVNRLADEYVEAFFERSPESATRRGIRGADQGRVTDNSLEALTRWQARETAWLAQVRAIDPAGLEGSPEWGTYGILRELLEGSVASRICRQELWPLSSTLPGWQASYPILAELQPIGTDSLRHLALQRVRGLIGFLDIEMANLQEGVREGYTAPRATVEAVVRQLDGLLGTAVDSSPFASPARRDSSPAFAAELASVLQAELYPAIQRYRDYLKGEYLTTSRQKPGVLAIPDGAECYRAEVRRFTTLDIPPEEVFAAGKREMELVRREMQALAERTFQTSDLPGLLQRLRNDPAFAYRSREEVVETSSAAIERARRASPTWFGILPRASLEIRQHPEFRQREGAAAQYSAPPDDGTQPGIFWISTYGAHAIPRAYGEATAFHEGIPGHHLQVAIAQERVESHPITRFFGFSGFAEGWALYGESLAAEMGLYSSDVARMGFLTNRAWRAARLVVDAGIHSRGWTREQALEYLGSATTLSPLQLQGEVDRYISWPGQATSYMLGDLEIREAREEAVERLGARFDIRAFHDQVLGNGGVTLPMLRRQVQRWIAAAEAAE
ncbi:MAG TPA: DUF885 domain-containing protein [Gemmatimonadales bacterium]|nr:DUF885 domain-containing protein [Gemmatimonadales bacterium]